MINSSACDDDVSSGIFAPVISLHTKEGVIMRILLATLTGLMLIVASCGSERAQRAGQKVCACLSSATTSADRAACSKDNRKIEAEIEAAEGWDASQEFLTVIFDCSKQWKPTKK